MEAGSFVFETQEDPDDTDKPKKPEVVEEEPAETTETSVFKIKPKESLPLGIDVSLIQNKSPEQIAVVVREFLLKNPDQITVDVKLLPSDKLFGNPSFLSCIDSLVFNTKAESFLVGKVKEHFFSF